MDAREVAVLALAASEQGGWSDGILKKYLAAAKLSSRDAALSTQLCYGVLQNKLLLDFYLQHESKLPLKRLENKVLQILRLAVFQMLFLDKIPDSAAVNTAVTLARKHSKGSRTAGMVNGILRSVQRNLSALPTPPREDFVAYLSVMYSHPAWLVERFCTMLGEQQCEEFLRANNTKPPMTIAVNTTKTTCAQLMQSLQDEGVAVSAHPWLADCLHLSKTGDIEQLTAFEQGLFYVQDVSSRLAILASGARAGMRVLDCCAAPGGKSFAMAIAMENCGEILSCDLHPHKIKLIAAGARRLGLDCIHAQAADAKVFLPEFEGAFDLVLVDAPCSGLGVIRKKPDIRYKNPEPLMQLPKIQLEILRNAARYVRAGGALLYSTCTVLKEENEAVIRAFCAENTQFQPETFFLPAPIGAVESGMLTLWPQEYDTDGFFICKLRKRG